MPEPDIMPGKPIKRNENIAPLSRDHHSGLLFCWKIKQGLKNRIELNRIRGYINYYWEKHLQQHFNEEEMILFSSVKDKLCENGFDQHKEIINLITNINKDQKDDPEAYAKLASLVDYHIRFEERELFPYLESVLSTEKLTEIGTQLKNLHTVNSGDEYKDEFWLKLHF